MPAERRTLTAVRPVKTERTHEENQERAYIAASRRSDRSLEARIESARRASEIHKKRTGRALRVTEQDVINEEMYEEEDDDLPTQYQRLNAHLHTTSVNFNKKLHDYIATQHGVRNMFMSQYSNPTFQPYGNATSFSPVSASSQQNHWLNPSMLPPQQFNPSSPQQSVTQQGFRHAPYNVPSRTNSHQRSLSIQLPNGIAAADPASQSAPAVTTPQDVNRRFSLPAHVEQRSSGPDDSSRPALSRCSTVQSPDLSVSSQAVSPNSASPSVTPQLHQSETPASYPYSPTDFPFNAQAMNSNPLSMSMPPESQQFIGSALDPNDPRTAMYMAGSDQIPQPFAPTYSYNPNFSGKMSALAADNGTSMAQTPSSGGIKSESAEMPALTMPTPMSEGFFSNEAFLTPGNGDYNAFFDFQGAGLSQTNEEQGDGSNFVNWD